MIISIIIVIFVVYKIVGFIRRSIIGVGVGFFHSKNLLSRILVVTTTLMFLAYYG